MGWSSQAVITSQVVIEGANDGLFVYNGTPGAGTLFFSIAASSGVDPYGNAYQAGATLYNGANKWINLSDTVGSAGITLNPDASVFGVAALINAFTSGTGSIEQGVLFLSSPNPFEEMNFELVSANASGSIPPTAVFTGGAVVTDTGVYQQVAGLTETWHDLAPTLTGWSQRASSYPLQYRMLASPPNSVQIQGDITGTALGSGTQTIATLPVAYRPVSHSTPAVPICTSGITTAPTNPPNLVIATDGTLQVRNGAGATDLQINCIIPLDGNAS